MPVSKPLLANEGGKVVNDRFALAIDVPPHIGPLTLVASVCSRQSFKNFTRIVTPSSILLKKVLHNLQRVLRSKCKDQFTA